MQIAFQLTTCDIVQAARAMRRASRGIRAVYWFLALLGVLCAGALYLGVSYGLVALELILIAAVATAIWAWPWIYVWQKTDDLRSTLQPQEWLFDSNGMHMKTPSSAHSYAWAAVRRAIEDQHFFLLFITEGVAHPIPKRALSSEQTLALRSGLRQWLGEKAQVLA